MLKRVTFKNNLLTTEQIYITAVTGCWPFKFWREFERPVTLFYEPRETNEAATGREEVGPGNS